MNFINRAFKNVTRKLSKTILLIITFFFIGNLVIIGLGIANAADDAKTLTRKKMRAVVTYEVDYDAIMRYTDTITDQDELDDFYKNYPQVKAADLKEILADSRVATANAFSNQTAYIADGYDFVHLNNEAEENMNTGGNQSCYIDENGNQQCQTYIEPVHFIKANMFPNMIEFIDGQYSLVDGRFYNQEEIDNAEYVALISQAFAEVNGLNVGDTYPIYVTTPNIASNYEGMQMDESVIKKEFEIVGIFDHTDKILPGSSNYNYTYPYENPDNMMLIPSTTAYMSTLELQQVLFDYYAERNPDDDYYVPENRPTEDAINNTNVSNCTFLLNDPLEVDDFVESYKGNLPQFMKMGANNEEYRPSMEQFEQNAVSDVTFLLNDPLEVDTFVESYQDKLAQFMKLDANNEEFHRLSKPLDTLGLYANFIIWLVVINAVIIISLVTALTLKTREYEIGVLLSIGASKFKIVAQFFIELALVAVVGFTLSVVSGSMIANKVGAKVLDFQIQESDVGEGGNNFNGQNDNIFNTNYSTSITLEDLTSEYSVTISPMIIVEIYILGLGIVLISILIPSLMIMRYNPKKILMNQN